MISRPINFLFLQSFKLLDIPLVEKREFSNQRRIQQLKSNLAQPCFKVADLSHSISQILINNISFFLSDTKIFEQELFN